MKQIILALVVIPYLAGFTWLSMPQRADSDVSPDVIRETLPLGLSASQAALREQVKAFFPDVPQMTPTVSCESHFRQFNDQGKPLISPTHDVGVAQINVPTWGKLAKELDLDIYNSSIENLIMARIVYEKQGIAAWACSK